MATAKSPFYVVENFLTPKQSEMIVDSLGFYTPDYDDEGTPLKMMRCHEDSESLIFDKIQPLVPTLEDYYDFDYRAMETVSFEFHPEGAEPKPTCDNSSYIKSKWVRTRDRDMTGIIFLSDYQDKIPFDSEYEVYGGKLEFPQHGFGFNPSRGTLIMYPSVPHFINAIAKIQAGDLFVARFHIAASKPLLYQPDNFPGDFTSWFKGHY